MDCKSLGRVKEVKVKSVVVDRNKELLGVGGKPAIYRMTSANRSASNPIGSRAYDAAVTG